MAALAALMGDRTAIALLCSLFAALSVQEYLEPFHPHYTDYALVCLDLVVLSTILRPNMRMADELIAALFLVSWFGIVASRMGYGDDGLRYQASWACVVLQFILCFPVAKLQKGLELFSHGPLRPSEGFNARG